MKRYVIVSILFLSVLHGAQQTPPPPVATAVTTALQQLTQPLIAPPNTALAALQQPLSTYTSLAAVAGPHKQEMTIVDNASDSETDSDLDHDTSTSSCTSFIGCKPPSFG